MVDKGYRQNVAYKVLAYHPGELETPHGRIVNTLSDQNQHMPFASIASGTLIRKDGVAICLEFPPKDWNWQEETDMDYLLIILTIPRDSDFQQEFERRFPKIVRESKLLEESERLSKESRRPKTTKPKKLEELYQMVIPKNLTKFFP